MDRTQSLETILDWTQSADSSQGGRRMDLNRSPESNQVEILTTNRKASGIVPRYSVHVLC